MECPVTFINSWTPKPDLICIQETWLKEEKTYNLPGYDIYRHDRKITTSKKCGGGCAIFIKRGLGFKYTDKSDCNTPIEYQIGELYDDHKNKINIINIYNPCSTLTSNSLNEIFGKTDKPYIICGDFNGHNPLWGSCKIDHNGKIIEDAIFTHNMICINSGKGTRINSNQGTLSCIDITLTSPRIATNCKWAVLNNTWGVITARFLLK